MTKIDLKKIKRISMLIFLALAVLFTVGAWDRIVEIRILSLPFYVTYGTILLLLGLALYLYLTHLQAAEKQGRHPFGTRFFETLHKYRFLLEQLVTRDFKVKYKRSVLGVFWSFLNPLFMMLVQYVVFSHLLNIRGDIAHYAIYLLCGIVIWNGFNDCSMQSLRSITGNAHLITKVYVPKYIYPISKVLSATINIVLSMVPLLLVTLVYGLIANPHLYLSEAVFLLPFALFLLLIFCIGIGFILSCLMVFFHDIEFLWSVFATIWMYATPIIYSLSMFESRAAWLVTVMQFNPMYHYINFVRTLILERTAPSFLEMGITVLISFAMFFIGFFIFRKFQDKFVLYL